MSNESLSKFASIAEIIAAVGVILSLIFVGAQLNEGNRETRAATMQAATDTEMIMQSQFVRYAGTWNKVMSGTPLDKGEESRRGIVLYNMLMTESENRYHQFQAGYIDDALWERRRYSLQKTVGLPFFEIWQDSHGAAARSPEFLELVEELRENQE